MGASTIPVAGASSKTRFALTLTSGTSWTVPTGVTYVNVTLQGGGGAGTNITTTVYAYNPGMSGQRVSSTLATTPGASITYAIGAGGAAQTGSILTPNAGGTTTFTGATSATGGQGGNRNTSGGITGSDGTSVPGFPNGGNTSYTAGAGTVSSAGGSGMIEVEYWV